MGGSRTHPGAALDLNEAHRRHRLRVFREVQYICISCANPHNCGMLHMSTAYAASLPDAGSSDRSGCVMQPEQHNNTVRVTCDNSY